MAAFKSGTEIEFKPDTGAPVDVKVTPETLARKIAPGETSLKNAVGASITDLMIGDRVLVTLESGTNNARRVVIMSATDIGKRDEADRQDWNTRGLSGVVAERSGDTITIRSQSLQGETRQTVTVSDQTKFRRYAADSVRFADAKPSRAAEISIGDQLRARGQKSADGNSVAAEEVVFGTFLVTAGSVVSANPDTKEITLKETGSGKPVVVQLTPDSRIKQMAALPGSARRFPRWWTRRCYSGTRCPAGRCSVRRIPAWSRERWNAAWLTAGYPRGPRRRAYACADGGHDAGRHIR